MEARRLAGWEGRLAGWQAGRAGIDALMRRRVKTRVGMLGGRLIRLPKDPPPMICW